MSTQITRQFTDDHSSNPIQKRRCAVNSRPMLFKEMFLAVPFVTVVLLQQIVAQDARGEGIPEKCILLQDDFDDDALDLCTWSVACGPGQSISEENMELCIEDGCLLNTVQEFDPMVTPLDVSVGVDLTGHATSWDVIRIITRSDGIANPPGCGEAGAGCSVRNGIVFSIDGAGSGSPHNDYRIERVVNGESIFLGICCDEDPNTSNIFSMRVTDDGNTLRLYISHTEPEQSRDWDLKLEVSDDTKFSTNHITFQNSNNSPPTIACIDNVVVRGQPVCTSCPADLDGDGEVRVPDLILLLASWGACD